MCGAVVAVTSDHHQEDVDNFELVLDAARTSATTSSSGAGQSGLPPAMSGAAANGTTDEGTATASPQEEASGAVGPCVTTQNCQADQSATPLSPPVVSMATTHYTLDELQGRFITTPPLSEVIFLASTSSLPLPFWMY